MITEAIDVVVPQQHFLKISFTRHDGGFTVDVQMEAVTEQELTVGIIGVLQELEEPSLFAVFRAAERIAMAKAKGKSDTTVN